MLRPNYSTADHVTAIIKMFRPSLVTRVTRFTLKEGIFFSKKKLLFCLFFTNLIKNASL